jgi:hypothetical protein
MAKLNIEKPKVDTLNKDAGDADAPNTDTLDHDVERQLRARIAELEALLDARTQTIVGMGARLAELQGDAPPALVERVRVAEDQLQQLRGTKVIRYSAVPRRLYGRIGRFLRG